MRLSRDSKINAYNDAIAALENQESESDEGDDKAARLWLADKLDKECNRFCARTARLKQKNRKG